MRLVPQSEHLEYLRSIGVEQDLIYPMDAANRCPAAPRNGARRMPEPVAYAAAIPINPAGERGRRSTIQLVYSFFKRLLWDLLLPFLWSGIKRLCKFLLAMWLLAIVLIAPAAQSEKTPIAPDQRKEVVAGLEKLWQLCRESEELVQAKPKALPNRLMVVEKMAHEIVCKLDIIMKHLQTTDRARAEEARKTQALLREQGENLGSRVSELDRAMQQQYTSLRRQIERLEADNSALASHIFMITCAGIVAFLALLAFLLAVRCRPAYPTYQAAAAGKPESREAEDIAPSSSPETKANWPDLKIMPPEAMLQKLIEKSKACRQRIYHPCAPASAWNMGVASLKGNVKQDNQDYAIAFEIGKCQVMVIADGCGGTPHGDAASYWAVCHAADSVANSLGVGWDWQTQNPAAVAATAVRDAYRELGAKGRKLHLARPKDGLNTTLIVLVATPGQYGYAYIGDGGGKIVRAAGEVENFLLPQKADPRQNHILSAVLGPVMEGAPVVGTMARRPGDFVLLGSDGVFDYVKDSFPKDALKMAIERNGDLQQTASHILMELTKLEDKTGYVCDDNVTLGLLAAKAKPNLGKGFWHCHDIAIVSEGYDRHIMEGRKS